MVNRMDESSISIAGGFGKIVLGLMMVLVTTTVLLAQTLLAEEIMTAGATRFYWNWIHNADISRP